MANQGVSLNNPENRPDAPAPKKKAPAPKRQRSPRQQLLDQGADPQAVAKMSDAQVNQALKSLADAAAGKKAADARKPYDDAVAKRKSLLDQAAAKEQEATQFAQDGNSAAAAAARKAADQLHREASQVKIPGAPAQSVSSPAGRPAPAPAGPLAGIAALNGGKGPTAAEQAYFDSVNQGSAPTTTTTSTAPSSSAAAPAGGGGLTTAPGAAPGTPPPPGADLSSLAALNGGAGPTAEEASYLQSLNAATGSANTVSATPQQLTDATKTFLQANPEFSWMFSNPDLTDPATGQNILAESILGNWDATKWQEELQQTKFYQKNGQKARDWAELAGSDPATAKTEITTETANLKTATQTLGVNLTEDQLTNLATQALQSGWADDPQQVTNHINSIVTYAQTGFKVNPYTIADGTVMDPATGKPFAPGTAIDSFTGRQAYYGPNGEAATPIRPTDMTGYSTSQFNGQTVYYQTSATGAPGATMVQGGGLLSDTLDKLRAEAKTYMVPVDDAALGQWAQQIVANPGLQASYDSYLKTQAKSLFPSMAGAIDAGMTPDQYASPYRGIIQATLGVSGANIDFTDPKYQRFVAGNPDPKTGIPSAMSLYDTQRTLMSDPTYNYMNTQNAGDRAAALAQGLGEMFGKTPTGGTGMAGYAAPRI